MKQEKTRKQVFNYLYAMAIIMVIDDHMNTRLELFTSIFPYNSFYMPLFVFISGYFYRRTGIIENLKHKTKKLLIPYTVWNIVMMGIAFVIDRVAGVDWIKIPTFEEVKISFIYEPLTKLNSPAWFVIMLFWVSIFYNLLRNVLKPGKVWDFVLTGVHLVVGLCSTYLCVNGYYMRDEYWVFGLKIAFYIQFYHYGYLFKEYFEKHLLKWNRVVVCSICVAINVCLIMEYGSKIDFYATAHMGNFSTWHLPIVTSFTGIIFYYEVMDFLSKKIGQNAIIDFISRNTFVIMQVHLLFANIPNFYAYYQAKHGNELYADFDIEKFQHTAGLRYNADARLIGFFCGLIGSLLVAWLLEKVKAKIKR